jgi:hypothetical protein
VNCDSPGAFRLKWNIGKIFKLLPLLDATVRPSSPGSEEKWFPTIKMTSCQVDPNHVLVVIKTPLTSFLLPRETFSGLVGPDISVCRAVVTRVLGLSDLEYEASKEVSIVVKTAADGYSIVFITLSAEEWTRIKSNPLLGHNFEEYGKQHHGHAEFRKTFGSTEPLCFTGEDELSALTTWLDHLQEHGDNVDIVAIRPEGQRKFKCVSRDVLLQSLESGQTLKRNKLLPAIFFTS